ncbi:hypothetical protein AEB_P1207 [Altererythrobacter sp. B11]|uniref:phasin family protein n=1 Tax=Altererythrobacter sp. B11 TaxID=2060312 RepID=UPI000DC733E0|nr:phasin family protein [Altererythrobacter sp. B11]BBC72075.1 hypothetical protein AEB_P1207 [Altererythrobacter sp. B11]
MADSPKKPDDSAEKAYAAAASGLKPAAEGGAKGKSAAAPKKAGGAKAAPKPNVPVKAPVKAKAQPKPKVPAPQKPAPVASAPAPKPVPAPPAVTAAPAPKLESKPVAAAPAPVPAPPVKPDAVKTETPEPTRSDEPTVSELKDKIMATAPNMTPNMTTPDYSSMLSEMQSKAKEAYEKSSEAMGEASEFAKGNVEALVESSKIFAGGMQDMSKTVVEEAKAAYETMTADMKEMAAVKSPTELFQLQGKIMRRNFDALVATSSKNTEAMMKLANDAFAPLSGRMNMAAEKMSKVA